MELKFISASHDCLEPVLREVQNMEQTQQIRLPDGLPDIGRVVGAWGQPVIRGKEWNDDSIGFTAGMLVWVLYAPEDGTAEQVLTGWMPFQSRWDLPEGTPEGNIRIRCLSRTVDARTVSPRKLLIRAGMAVLAEAFAPCSIQTSVPTGETGEIRLLKERYPMRLYREAGEKTFTLEEAFPWPEASAPCQAIVAASLEPELTECRVLTDKLVFRGVGRLKLLCRCEDGQTVSRDLELPFSQYEELQGSYDSDPMAQITFGVTSLEPEIGEDGQLKIRCGVLAQYLVSDRELVEAVLDADSSRHALEIGFEDVIFPAVLDTRRENLYGERTIHTEAERIADIRYLPDFPQARISENGASITVPGILQLLCCGPEGQLYTHWEKWELQQELPAAPQCAIGASSGIPEVKASLSGGTVSARVQLPLSLDTTVRQQIPMVTSVEPGVEKKPDPARPSLVLTRFGGRRLWDLAKENGTTMEAIQSATGLTGEPEPGQMLLIPIP